MFGNDKRDAADSVYLFISDETVEARNIKAIGGALLRGAASEATGSVFDDVFNNRDKREVGDIYLDAGSGVVYADVPDSDVAARSLKAIGTAIAGGIATGAASSIVGDLFGNNKRDSGDIYLDSDTGILYADVADPEVEARSIKAIGTAIAGGIASGAASSIIGNIFNNRRDVGDLFVDTDTGILYANVPNSAVESRNIKALGGALLRGAASGIASDVFGDSMNRRGVEQLD